MRATVDIEERMLSRAKKLAASSERTLGEVIDAALTAYLAGRDATGGDGPFELIVRGRPGARFPGAPEIAEVVENDDVASLAGRRRGPS